MTVLCFAVMTLSASLASLLLKQVSSNKFFENFKKPKFWLAAFLYVLSAAINIYLLTKLQYSVVVTLGSLTYVWTLILSNRILNEKINLRKAAGVVLILAGVLFIAAK